MMKLFQCPNPILDESTTVRPLEFADPPWQIVQCTETGFVFLANPPSYDELADEFDWHKTFETEKKRRATAEPILARCSQTAKQLRSRFQQRRDPLYSLAKSQVLSKTELAVLDVGSGRGHRLVNLCRRFENRNVTIIPWGIEISRGLAEISDSAFRPLGGSVVRSSAMEGMTKFPIESTDMIVMSCYLEHEASPLEVLRRAHRILRPDGGILVKVPNYGCWNRRIRGKKWCGFRIPDHVNYFTPRTLNLVATRAGFRMQQRMSDRLPTSDNMYAVLHKSSLDASYSRAA